VAPTSPWNDARRHASVNNRSIPDQIEYWSRIGKLAEENPDLPYEFIKGILLGLQEIKDGDVREDKTPWQSLRPRNSYVNSSKDPESITSYILQTSAVNSNFPFTLGSSKCQVTGPGGGTLYLARPLVRRRRIARKRASATRPVAGSTLVGSL